MCISAPKPPPIQKIPDRQAVQMPDAGDPNVLAALRGGGGSQLRTSSMIFANKSGTLGAPSIASPLGTKGY